MIDPANNFVGLPIDLLDRLAELDLDRSDQSRLSYVLYCHMINIRIAYVATVNLQVTKGLLFAGISSCIRALP